MALLREYPARRVSKRCAGDVSAWVKPQRPPGEQHQPDIRGCGAFPAVELRRLGERLRSQVFPVRLSAREELERKLADIGSRRAVCRARRVMGRCHEDFSAMAQTRSGSVKCGRLEGTRSASADALGKPRLSTSVRPAQRSLLPCLVHGSWLLSWCRSRSCGFQKLWPLFSRNSGHILYRLFGVVKLEMTGPI